MVKGVDSLYVRWGKRALDLALTIPSLIILLPLIALIAFQVRRRLGTPVFFSQSRAGLDGKPFRLIKFRTMTSERGPDNCLLPDEERMTRFGAWLRNTSLDELPELVNVLRGEMSLVGPRPLLLDYLPLYSERQSLRHSVRPGLTGWAQINGRNLTSWPRRLEHDVWYVEHLSLLLDLGIILKTVGKVLHRTGISGEGEVTMSRFTGGTVEDEEKESRGHR